MILENQGLFCNVLLACFLLSANVPSYFCFLCLMHGVKKYSNLQFFSKFPKKIWYIKAKGENIKIKKHIVDCTLNDNCYLFYVRSVCNGVSFEQALNINNREVEVVYFALFDAYNVSQCVNFLLKQKSQRLTIRPIWFDSLEILFTVLKF